MTDDQIAWAVGLFAMVAVIAVIILGVLTYVGVQ